MALISQTSSTIEYTNVMTVITVLNFTACLESNIRVYRSIRYVRVETIRLKIDSRISAQTGMHRMSTPQCMEKYTLVRLNGMYCSAIAIHWNGAA